MATLTARMSLGNRKIYESGSVAEHYAALAHLFPAEQTLLLRLGEALPRLRMLDLGVGGGRTSVHFAHRVQSYLGVDYSSAMIESCRQRFPDPPKHIAFSVGDARSLSGCADGSFDFILFSFNGLDYVGDEDRRKVFQEMRRLLAPGGCLGFSSHNLMSLGLPSGPADRSWQARFQRLALRALNGNLRALREGDYSVIRDDGCRFRLRTFYVRPSVQVRQLRSLGLMDVTTLGLDGREVDAGDPDSIGDAWLYYVGRLP